MDADPRVLVCYASAAGSTRGIAERIADRIRTDLLRAGTAAPEVVSRPAAPDLDPEDYDALVVGSAVHNMAWLPAATSFLGRAAGRAAPVWVFSVGGVEPRGPLTRMLAAQERGRIERAFPAGFAARDHRLFGGVVVMTGVPLWGRLFWRLIGGRPGDHRNWPAIEAWAADIATEVAGRLRVSRGAKHRP
jgi:menaquinone-dependent protoporphyrinogen oxidase